MEGTASSNLVYLWLVFPVLFLASKVGLSELWYALDWHVHIKNEFNLKRDLSLAGHPGKLQ